MKPTHGPCVAMLETAMFGLQSRQRQDLPTPSTTAPTGRGLRQSVGHGQTDSSQWFSMDRAQDRAHGSSATSRWFHPQDWRIGERKNLNTHQKKDGHSSIECFLISSFIWTSCVSGCYLLMCKHARVEDKGGIVAPDVP